MIHNVVVVDGKEYKSVMAGKGGGCNGCAGASNMNLCKRLGDCDISEREDSTDAILKPHYKLNHNSEV